jgi:pimeloyl-ACP methyl ester carboxylesterase
MQNEIIEYGGLQLGTLTAGDSAKPCLVLLHGWPQSKEVYDQVLDALAIDHFVLAFDLPGIGASRGAPRSAEKLGLADVILGASEKAGARSIVIAGFDVGGMIAYAAARDHGARIQGALVMNTVIPGLDPWEQLRSDPQIWHFAFHAVPDLPELLVSGHQRAYFDFFTNFLAGRKQAVTEHHRDVFARAYERPESLKAGFDWYRSLDADAARNREAKAVTTPLLYARGDADGRSPDEYVRSLEQAGARRVRSQVLQSSGEFAPLEVPQQFTEVLLAFARDCQGTELV